jgi:hypothetical protein
MPNGMLNFPIPQTRARWLVSGRVGGLLDRLFNYPAVLVLVLLRLGAASVLLSGVSRGPTETGLCVLVAATSISLSLRTPFGNDGADQMAILIFSALSWARVAGTLEAAAISLWFIALQTCLSYITSGVAKVTARGWRNGTAIKGIFRTVVYGHSTVGRLVHRFPTIAIIAGWMVIVTECGFSLVLFCPKPIAFVFIVGGLLFHASSAVLMGLNTFLWEFVATYPALLYCASDVSERLWCHKMV